MCIHKYFVVHNFYLINKLISENSHKKVCKNQCVTNANE